MLEDPTAGIDVGAKLELTRRYGTADGGMGFLWLSSDVTETLTLCDRIYAMYAGRIVAESWPDIGRRGSPVVGRARPQTAGGLMTDGRRRGLRMARHLGFACPYPGDCRHHRVRRAALLVARQSANLARQLAPLLILATGQLFAVISRGLDLSIAANMALAGVVGVLVVPFGGLGLALVAMVLTGLGVGLANGLIVVGFSVSPLIVTLGMLSVARGIALLLTGGLPLYKVPNSLVDLVGSARSRACPCRASSPSG